jgi:hypothetical protein
MQQSVRTAQTEGQNILRMQLIMCGATSKAALNGKIFLQLLTPWKMS